MQRPASPTPLHELTPLRSPSLITQSPGRKYCSPLCKSHTYRVQTHATQTRKKILGSQSGSDDEQPLWQSKAPTWQPEHETPCWCWCYDFACLAWPGREALAPGAPWLWLHPCHATVHAAAAKVWELLCKKTAGRSVPLSFQFITSLPRRL